MAIQKFDLKNGVHVISGVLLIAGTFILNGFLSFVDCGFDPSAIKTGQYWTNFANTMLSEIAVMFGMYLIQKNKDLSNKSVTSLQDKIDKFRNVVYEKDCVTKAEFYLKNIYNYQQRLDIYDKRVKDRYSKLILREPHTSEKGYEKKQAKYLKIKAERDFLKKQMDFIKEDNKRLILIQSDGNQEEIDALTEKLNTDEYKFQSTKIKYKDVCWGDLQSGSSSAKSRKNAEFFSEFKEVSKSVINAIGWGCVLSAYIYSIVFPSFHGINLAYFIKLIIMAVCLIWFMSRGVMLSKKIILGSFVYALEKRKSIYCAIMGYAKIEYKFKDDDTKIDEK